MKSLVFSSTLFFSSIVFSANLMDAVVFEGPKAGMSCRAVVTDLLVQEFGGSVKLLSYENLTAGTWNQEFEARFLHKGKVRSVRLEGEFDCDSLSLSRKN